MFFVELCYNIDTIPKHATTIIRRKHWRQWAKQEHIRVYNIHHDNIVSCKRIQTPIRMKHDASKHGISELKYDLCKF